MDDNKSVTATFTQNVYTLTINTVGNGTVVADPSAPYDYGTEVTLTATADTGWTFTGWSGAGCCGTGTCSITMDDNKSVTATFTQNVYALTINTVGNGTVVADPVAPYHYGDVVTLTATADTGWTFTGWSGAGCSGTGTCSITMDDNKSVMATFTQNVYTLTINKVGNGTVVAAPLMPYHYGDAVTLTATADTGWTFNDWSGACAGIGSCSVTMDDNKTVTATFTINTFTITASAGANGSITPSGAISVNYGASQSFTITPNSGYHVADVLVDGGSVAAVTRLPIHQCPGEPHHRRQLRADGG